MKPTSLIIIDGVSHKICGRKECRKTLPITEFYKNSSSSTGLSCYCKSCEAAKSKRTQSLPGFKNKQSKRWKRYYHRNIPKMRKRYADFYHSEYGKNQKKAYDATRWLDPQYRDRRLLEYKIYRTQPQVKLARNKVLKNRRKKDVAYRMREVVRTGAWHALKGKKDRSCVKLLGCSIPEFVAYVESLWKEGMNWDNYGRCDDCWSLDHIVCLALFDFSIPSHQFAALSFKNVRPIWHKDNLLKNDSLPDGRRARYLTNEDKRLALINLGFDYLFTSTGQVSLEKLQLVEKRVQIPIDAPILS